MERALAANASSKQQAALTGLAYRAARHWNGIAQVRSAYICAYIDLYDAFVNMCLHICIYIYMYHMHVNAIRDLEADPPTLN